MEIVSHVQSNSVLQQYPINTSTVLTNTENNLISKDAPTFISIKDTSSIVVEIGTSTTILAGAIGPAGASTEELDVYSKRIDFISDDEFYKGEAFVGSPENTPVWRIRKTSIGPGGDVTETWAEGSASFDKIWTNRLSLIYS